MIEREKEQACKREGEGGVERVKCIMSWSLRNRPPKSAFIVHTSHVGIVRIQSSGNVGGVKMLRGFSRQVWTRLLTRSPFFQLRSISLANPVSETVAPSISNPQTINNSKHEDINASNPNTLSLDPPPQEKQTSKDYYPRRNTV